MFPGWLRILLQTVIVLTVGSVLLAQGVNRGAQKTIVKVEIESDSHFVANPTVGRHDSGVFIRRQQAGRYCRAYGESVDTALIEALRVALNEPPLTKPTLKNLGITRDWLQGYSWLALHNQLRASAPKQVLARSFSNPAVIRRVVRDMFNDRPHDLFDVQFVRFIVTFDDDSQVSGDGAGPSPFLLPWDITRNGRAITTYNAHISRALADLMLAQDTNQDVLAGQPFGVEVVDAVERYVESNWKFWMRETAQVRP